jgi:hypothetical protein
MKNKQLSIIFFSILSCFILLTSCTKDDTCPSVSCQNGGTINESDCSCDCPPEYTGTNCETEDLCFTQNVNCQNGGTCEDGVCDCPEGYFGVNCESFDLSKIQLLLENHSPIELFSGGVPLDSLYGKIYGNGYIFYLDTVEGNGMVAALGDHPEETYWGCLQNIRALNDVETEPTVPDTAVGARLGDGRENTNVLVNLSMTCIEEGYAARVCRNLGDDWFLPSRGELTLIGDNLSDRSYGNLSSGSYYWSSTEANQGSAWIHRFIDNDYYMEFKEFDNGILKHSVRAVKEF